jgi:hypothetical protein
MVSMRRQQPQDRVCECALPGTRLAKDSKDLAGINAEVHALKGMNRLLSRRKIADRQTTDFQYLERGRLQNVLRACLINCFLIRNTAQLPRDGRDSTPGGTQRYVPVVRTKQAY